LDSIFYEGAGIWSQRQCFVPRQQELNYFGEEWESFKHSLRIWQFCNYAFHSDENSKGKHYKLEEPKRGKHDSDPDMQNSIH
jgi:hypothetical protein